MTEEQAKNEQLAKLQEGGIGIEPSVAANRSLSIAKLAGALAKAQLSFQPVRKNTENLFYKSKYADLSAVIEATQKALAENGLVIIQSPKVDFEGKKAGVVSTLAHESGEWWENELLLPAKEGEKFDAQKVGSAVTYARRYSYQSIIGVAAELDDDANSASGLGTKEAARDVAKSKTAAAGESVPAMFYTWYDDTQTAVITGSSELMEKTQKIWRPLWDTKSGCIRVNGEQLEGLKYELEQAKILFRPLKAK